MSTTGQPQRQPATPPLLVALLAVLLVLAPSCGGDTEPIAGTTTIVNRSNSTGSTSSTGGPSGTTTDTGTSPTTTATSTPVDPTQQAIIDAYIGYWDARLAANTGTPNPQNPALAQFATGNQLDSVISETQQNLDDDRAFQAAPNPANFRRVTVVSVDGDRAEVQECFVDDTQVITRSTGQVVNDTVSTQSVVGKLRLVDGAWRVSGSELIQRWEGVAGCALAS